MFRPPSPSDSISVQSDKNRKKHRTAQTRYFCIPDLDETITTLQTADPTQKPPKLYPHLISQIFYDFMTRNLSTDPSEFKTYEGFAPCTHRYAADFYSDMSGIAKQIDLHKHTLKNYQEHIKAAEATLANPQAGSYEKQKAEQTKTDCIGYIKDTVDVSGSDPKDRFITRIVENLETATKIKHIVTSTPDDQGNGCGSGFVTILKPFELKAMQGEHTVENVPTTYDSNGTKHHLILNRTCYPSFSDISKELKLPQHATRHNAANKNDQIISLINYIMSQHGNKDDVFVFDFVDDVKSIQNMALKIDPKSLPSNVILRVFEAHAFKRKPIKYIDCVKGTGPFIEARASIDDLSDRNKMGEVEQKAVYLDCPEGGDVIYASAFQRTSASLGYENNNVFTSGNGTTPSLTAAKPTTVNEKPSISLSHPLN